MKSWGILVVLCLSLFSVYADESENSSMIVGANIYEPVASVEVPDYIFLGSLTKGYKTSGYEIEITNTGTSDLIVTPVLANPNNIFSNLYFGTSSCASTCRQIGNYSLEIDRPDTFGGEESEKTYVKLDLTNFSGNINSDLMNYTAEVIFWVMPR